MAAHGSQSGLYNKVVIGNLRPKMLCVQFYPHIVGPRIWNIALPDGHSDIEQLAGFAPFSPIIPSGYLNFGSGLNEVNKDWTSRTVAFIFMPRWDTASGISEDVSIFNMKLWIENDSAFSGLSPQPYIQMLPSGKWIKNLVLTSGAYGAFEVPRSLPSQPNINRIDGMPWLSGVGHERTQIIYSSIILTSGTYPVGRYGGLGAGTFLWHFTYDWTAKDAHINIGVGSGSYTDY
jgi:hypothetical protein